MSDNVHSIRPSPKPPEVSPIRIFTAEGHLRTLEAIERDVICLAIVMSNGCMTKAAAQLGIGRSTLYRKLPELEASLAYVPWAT
jgi:transcriptional regulator of acetoin/glycerol metabolism